MPTTTNYGWTTPADTDLVKDGAAAIRTLGSSIDTTTKNLNPQTTTGAIAYRSATANINTALPIGTAGQVLAVNSGATAPEWVSLAAPGGMTLISETVASANSSITFSAISGSYKQLLLVWAGIQHSGIGSDFGIRLNNNSGSVYALTGLGNLNSGTYANTIVSGLTTSIGRVDYFPFGTDASGAALAASAKGTLLVDNYASSTKAKTFECSFSYNDQSVGERQATIQGIFNSITAITSLEIVRMTGTDTISNQTDTTVRLYGVA